MLWVVFIALLAFTQGCQIASNVLGARSECGFSPKSVLVIESHLASKPLQIRHNLEQQINCDLLSFCFLGLLTG